MVMGLERHRCNRMALELVLEPKLELVLGMEPQL